MSFFGFMKDKTMRTRKKFDHGTKRYSLYKHSVATLGSKNVRDAVKLPEGESLNDWIAVAIVDFYNKVNLLVGAIEGDCTKESCPSMTAGPKFEFFWAEKKKLVRITATEYIQRVLDYVASELDNENTFPPDPSKPFPKNFLEIASNIFKRIFRIFAHIYYSHFQQITDIGAEAHLNTTFKHFIYFVQEFKLIKQADLEPLSELISTF
ncbi:mob kinase activator-like 1 [Anaeramoeba ignava]|uniref:Mob kinase activator-like 1 n=1 Tax=Anaeramoeba ignava TaxID=1746090 RepID=A0A9Q0R7I3_ANAIG|nr:mob kinase activator-like 1 [Anaeramoeba ignava]